jgi:hypothetical protein
VVRWRFRSDGILTLIDLPTLLAHDMPADLTQAGVDAPVGRRSDVRVTIPPVLGDSWRGEWRSTLGPAWPALLALFVLCLFVGGATTPLSDADLPMHLALGEWIVRHHAVPFVEPFAWTRAGEPFFAYSWAMEVMYYALLSAFGPNGLHVLQGLTLALAGVAVGVLGAVARWSGWTTLLMAALHLVVGVGVVPTLRPQGVLLVVVPLAWALAMRVRDAERTGGSLAGLVACAAVAANSHLFFPLTAVPGVVLLAASPANWRRVGAFTVAVLVGWMISPYALHWLDIYRLNFAPHALYTSPSPVDEYTPGFSALFRGGGTGLLLVPLLSVLPWLTATRLNARERLLYGFIWFVGLITFAVAIRGLLPWWLVSMPLTAIALGALAPPVTQLVITTQRTVVVAIFGAMALLGGGFIGDPWQRADALPSRRLPSSAASGIEPIAIWLDCKLRPDAPGRLLTTFNFGSYARWRMPNLSESIDGRTIFPDSAAAGEGYFLPVRRTLPLPPWRSAEVAIVPLSYPVAGVLDTASAWRRVATASDLNGPATIIGLWVNRDWWSRSSAEQLPAHPVTLFHRTPGKPVCN